MPLSIQIKGLAELRQRLGRWSTAAWVAAVGPQAGEVILQSLRLYVAVKTGQTRDRLGYTLDGTHVRAGGDAVAGYLAWGTAPHTILPRNGRGLHWTGAGGEVFARRVNHPGTRATLFQQTAWATARGEVQAIGRAEALALLGVA